MFTHYILNKSNYPIQCDDNEEWSKWMQENNRIVNHDFVGDILISTVFLGVDHSWGGGPPELFETMTFAKDESPWDHTVIGRYTFWDEAVDGHEKAVREISSYVGRQ